MGSSSSKLVKKIFGPSNGRETRGKHSFTTSHSHEDDFSGLENIVARLPPSLGPLVLYRTGSMFFDEDGDLAHEFYVEVKEGRKSKMKKVHENLKPQGKVRLPFPRLRHDCPVILYVL